MGIGSLVMSAALPMSLTSLHGPSAMSLVCPGTRLNIRSDSSRTTFLGELTPRARAWRARSFTRMSVSFQPGNPRRRSSRIGRGAAEQSAAAWVTGSISSSMRMSWSPRSRRKSRSVSAMACFSLRERSVPARDAPMTQYTFALMDKGVVAAGPLRRFTADVFVGTGLSAADAAVVADALVWANLRGMDSHGVARVPGYVEWMRRGDINVKPHMLVSMETPAVVLLDADRAAGPVAMTAAMHHAVRKAGVAGAGLVFVRATTHTAA